MRYSERAASRARHRSHLQHQLRRRVQIDERLDQLNRRQHELEEKSHSSLDLQVPPAWQVFGQGSLFVLGVALILASLFFKFWLIGFLGLAAVALGWAMLAGRFLMMVPMLALAGNLARKKSVPPSSGTFPVNTTLFTVLLVGVILIVGALTFFPALSLGPILEHLLMQAGKTF